MKNGVKIALAVVGGLVVLGGITRLVTGGDQNKPAATTTAAVEEITTTTTAATTTTARTTAETAPIEKKPTIYLLNPESKKIHYTYCSTIEHPENFTETTDFEKAIADGYEPCGRCNPRNLN